MKRLIVLYNHPDDAEAFDRHYREVHCPLVRRMPGLLSFTFSRGPIEMGADGARYHLVAELTYPSQAELDASFAAPEGQAAIADLENFASAGTTMLTFDVEDGLARG